MFTIFSVPKRFDGQFRIIQRNAIVSWTKIIPKPEIILFGNEKGIADICKEFNLINIPNIKRNKFGTPLLDNIFLKAQKISKYNTLAFILTDIIFLSYPSEIIKNVRLTFKQFLLIGQRYEVRISNQINFHDEKWRQKFNKDYLLKSKLKGSSWMDYFIFSKNVFSSIPAFAIGRTFWDKWFVWHALSESIPVIDCTSTIIAAHQSHDYSHVRGNSKWVWEGEEAKRNIELAGGWSHGKDILNATCFYLQNEITQKPNNFNLLKWIKHEFRNLLDKHYIFNPLILRARRLKNKI